MKIAERILSRINDKPVVEAIKNLGDLESWTAKELKKLKMGGFDAGDLVEMVRFASNNKGGLKNLVDLIHNVSNAFDDGLDFEEAKNKKADKLSDKIFKLAVELQKSGSTIVDSGADLKDQKKITQDAAKVVLALNALGGLIDSKL